MTNPRSYAEVLRYIGEHEDHFGYKPVAILLTKDELDDFLRVIQVEGAIRPKEPFGYTSNIKVAGVRVMLDEQ